MAPVSKLLPMCEWHRRKEPPGAVTDGDVWMGAGLRGALRAAFTDAARAAEGEEQ